MKSASSTSRNCYICPDFEIIEVSMADVLLEGSGSDEFDGIDSPTFGDVDW